MADLEIKNVATPDETRPFVDKGRAAVVDVAGHPVLYGTFEPGWRWSENLKPIAGTDSCQATHLLCCLSGRMRVEMSSGEQGEIGPGDVAAIGPGTMRGLLVTSPACRSTSAAMPNTQEIVRGFERRDLSPAPQRLTRESSPAVPPACHSQQS